MTEAQHLAEEAEAFEELTLAALDAPELAVAA
jgi:hypothetical protein